MSLSTVSPLKLNTFFIQTIRLVDPILIRKKLKIKSPIPFDCDEIVRAKRLATIVFIEDFAISSANSLFHTSCESSTTLTFGHLFLTCFNFLR